MRKAPVRLRVAALCWAVCRGKTSQSHSTARDAQAAEADAGAKGGLARDHKEEGTYLVKGKWFATQLYTQPSSASLSSKACTSRCGLMVY